MGNWKHLQTKFNDNFKWNTQRRGLEQTKLN